MSTNAEQESKRIWPCVRCAESTFRKKIAPKLKKYGYKIWAIGGDWRIWSCVCTNFENEGKWVSNEKPSDIKGDRYLCRTIPEFLAAVKALAIERGWFKEEMKWKEMCNISELPTRLRRLAEYRKNTEGNSDCRINPPQSVDYFVWDNTPEGHSFWKSVYHGCTPCNLEKVLDKFEKEHPELLDEPKQEEEAVSEKETTTDNQDQESKNIIYRCEREQIDIVTDTLKGLGVKDCTVPNATNDNTIFLVNTKDRRKFIRCTYCGDNKSNVIECSTLDEFLQKVEDETTTTLKRDNVNHPSHYTWLKDLCGIEVIDITRHMDFDLGNAMKYILRAGHKSEQGMTDEDKTIEDLKKAVFYLNDKIKMLENNAVHK